MFFFTANKTLSNRLMFVKQKVISNNDCQKHFQPQMVQVPQICTVGWDNAQQTACFGDHGGSLDMEECGRWTQVAVMSHIHLDGCAKSRPVVYSRVGAYIDWISKTANYSFRP